MTGNRTVSAFLFPPSRRGMCCAFFSFCFFVSGSVSFVVFVTILLFRGSLFGKIFGSELLFCGVGVCLVFLVLFCLCFCFIFCSCRSRNCLGKILLMSGLVLFGFFSLLLWFSRRRRPFCFFERDSSGSNRARPHMRLFRLFPFPCFCPRRDCYCPFWTVRPFFLAFCRGASLGPGRFSVFRILSEHWGA